MVNTSSLTGDATELLLNDLLAEALHDPGTADADQRSSLVCVVLQTVVAQLQADVRAANITRATQALLLLQKEVERRPAFLLMRAHFGSEEDQSKTGANGESEYDELCYWSIPRLVRILIALAKASESAVHELLAVLRNVLAHSLRALCAPSLVASGGTPKAREIVLELLRLCSALCTDPDQYAPTSTLHFVLFAEHASATVDDDDPFEDNVESNHRPYRLAVPRGSCNFVAAEILLAVTPVALAPRGVEAIRSFAVDVEAKVLDVDSCLLSLAPSEPDIENRAELATETFDRIASLRARASTPDLTRFFDAILRYVDPTRPVASPRAAEIALRYYQLCNQPHSVARIASDALQQTVVVQGDLWIRTAAAADEDAPSEDWPPRRTVAFLLLMSLVSHEPVTPSYLLLDATSQADFEGQLIALRSGDLDNRQEVTSAFVEAVRGCPLRGAVLTTGRKRKRPDDETPTSPTAAVRPAVNGSGHQETWIKRVNAIFASRQLPESIETASDFQHTVLKLVSSAYDMDEASFKRTIEAVGLAICAFGCVEEPCGCHNLATYSRQKDRVLSGMIAESLMRLMGTIPRSPAPNVSSKRLVLLKALSRSVAHSTLSKKSETSVQFPLLMPTWLAAESRNERLASGRLLAVYLKANQPVDRTSPADLPADTEALVKAIEVACSTGSLSKRDTATTTCSTAARIADGEMLSRLLLVLVKQLSATAPLRDMAYLQLNDLIPLRAATAYKLMAPHMKLIGFWLAEQLVQDATNLRMGPMNNFAYFVGLTCELLMKTIASHLVPRLVETGELCSLHATPILTHVLMDVANPTERREIFDFMLSVVPSNVSLKVIVDAHLTPLLCMLLAERGSERAGHSQKAKQALQHIESIRSATHRSSVEAVSRMLNDHVLAILTRINDDLNDFHGKRTAHDKCCIIRGLGSLISDVGPNIASVSPQIMAALQSTLRSDGLVRATLHTWYTFVSVQRFDTVGPQIAPTSAAIVREWSRFDESERLLASKVLSYLIADNSISLKQFVEDITDFSNIPELLHVQQKIEHMRTKQTFESRLNAAISRVTSENDSIELQGLRDLCRMLQRHASISPLASGDTFSPVLGRLVSALTVSIIRDGNGREQIRDLAYQCIGLAGPLDPDRLDMPAEEPPIVLLHNFNDMDENVEFCVHLIKNVLVGVYRSSIDMKHQTALAFAIQELLKLCGLNKYVTLTSSKQTKQHKIWNDLPPPVLETITPLLDSKFSVTRSQSATSNYPFYTAAASYREWLRGWALSLIESCRDQKSGKVLGVISSAIKFSDVGVTQQLMPHLVLTAMLSGGDAERSSICEEFMLVLRDQLQPMSDHSADSRSLCAQTVFGLMDHIGRYLRLRQKIRSKLRNARRGQNAIERERDDATRNATASLERVMDSVDHDLQARAAFESRSFSRSLLNFEQVIRVMDTASGRDIAQEQRYLEMLHQVYAELDEPDGMEGVSTRLIAPSVWTQIREHESTGRWTSAQSCWEVQLQLDSQDTKSHVGLLKCLRNLGHYDSMRTHILGVLQEHPEWRPLLASFEIEGALVSGDWAALQSTLQIPNLQSHEAAFGRVLVAMRDADDEAATRALALAREQVGSSIVAAGKVPYPRVYNTFLDLNVLHELEMIFKGAQGERNTAKTLKRTLKDRLECSSPAFQAREFLLSMRRAALRLSALDGARLLIGNTWLETAKIARKAGHVQTAYSAVLRAAQLDTPDTFLQSAQLKHDEQQTQKAIQELNIALGSRAQRLVEAKKTDDSLAKASLRAARWMDEAGRFEHNEIAELFRQAVKLKTEWETPFYDLGHYYDERWKRLLSDGNKSKLSAIDADHCVRLPPLIAGNLHHALKYGNKYVYQALPRLLTIWLELASEPSLPAYFERKDALAAVGKGSRSSLSGKQDVEFAASVKKAAQAFELVHTNVFNASKDLPMYQWLTVYPQLVARVMHRLKRAQKLLLDLLTKTMSRYPDQCLWWIVGSVKSTQKERVAHCRRVTESSIAIDSRLQAPINSCLKLVDQMLQVCSHPVESKQDTLSLAANVPGLPRTMPSTMIIPLQSSMIASLPPTGTADFLNYQPFPQDLPTFQSVLDEVEIMSSVAKPRKVTFEGSDGRHYPFLLKPKDDLRKDARIMDFNAMINKLLRKDTESRRRQLHIRTYGVVPLNETCGIIEWVSNCVPLRPILLKLYETRGIKACEEVKNLMTSFREDPDTAGERFEKELLAKWPGVFHEWFLDTFPEPTAWLRSRLAYARTYAVMAMVGFVIGLGDRHCENILFDSNTGETLHVDLNCLFEAGKTFEIPERVPFRLTQNIVDGLGVTGIDGVFRRACEVAMRILRNNRDSLMSVLEAFVHDPLSEWGGGEGEKSKRRKGDESDRMMRHARRALNPIEAKLRGTRITFESIEKSVAFPSEVQVDSLLKEARNPNNLSQMYVGYIPWL